MKTKHNLPIPFVVLILAGAVSLFSIIATGTSRTGMVRDDSSQVQMVEQERMTALYFRILSWLSNVTPRTPEPAKANPQPIAVPQVGKTPQRHARQTGIELCTLHSAENLASANHHTHPIN
jgi:hypothetical protein